MGSKIPKSSKCQVSMSKTMKSGFDYTNLKQTKYRFYNSGCNTQLLVVFATFEFVPNRINYFPRCLLELSNRNQHNAKQAKLWDILATF